MATSEVVQEIADLTPELRVEPVQPVRVNSTKRFQHRMDVMVRRWKIEQDISRALNVLVDKYDQLVRKQSAEIKQLEQSLTRALDLRDQYAQRLRQRLKAPPLQPKFHHEREGK